MDHDNSKNSNLPILYSFRRCPYAMRARMALHYANITCQYREVDLKNKPESMLEYSPKGTVPVLILSAGEVIDESLDIINYALAQNDPKNLLANEQGIEDIVQREINRADREFIKLVSKYKYFERFPEQTQAEYLQQIENQFLDGYEKQLKEHGFIAADKETKADMAIIPFMRQFAYVDKSYFAESKYPHIFKWLNGYIQTDAFEAVMARCTPWKEGDDLVVFP